MKSCTQALQRCPTSAEPQCLIRPLNSPCRTYMLFATEGENRTTIELAKKNCLIRSRGRSESDLHSGLHEVQPHGQGLPHEDVGVVRGLEGLLQLLQLPPVEVGPRPPPLALAAASRTGVVLAVRVSCNTKQNNDVTTTTMVIRNNPKENTFEDEVETFPEILDHPVSSVSLRLPPFTSPPPPRSSSVSATPSGDYQIEKGRNVFRLAERKTFPEMVCICVLREAICRR
ncbi:hypothetical protein CEXT_62991 [Caerostris extrusa]|uniref:Uncharacterized protein n=1 Tax=Caerostris extrusa TaxID=172846 RepID=A0AAV4VM25_CAEEX|nr:hypothetical protein CEXT_62991 [Caerostris extrusa]